MTKNRNLKSTLIAATAALSLGLVVCIVLAVRTGATSVTYHEMLSAVISGKSTAASSIIFDIRFPRVLLAAVVGAILASGGASLQGLLGNPLAEPYTVGVSSGCVLGASLAFAFGWDQSLGPWIIPFAAFVTGLAAVAIVFVMSRRSQKMDVNTFLLSGIIVGAFFWSVTIFVLTASSDDLARIFRWFVGSFETDAPWDYFWRVLKIAVVMIGGLLYFARDLNAFAMGEESARQLGVEPERLKGWIIGLVALGTAASVAAAGVIGFVGLIVPHAMRRVFGSDHRLLIVSSALSGACLLVLADALARGLAPPREIPVGVITAVIGAPVFLIIMSRGRR